MPEPEGYVSADLQVQDEENAVDTRIKDRIINLREEVDEWAKELFTQDKMGEIDHSTAVSLWGDRVRAYLMAIEPLLWNRDLDNAEDVYLHEDLGVVTVHPPQEYQQADRQRARRNGDDVEILESEPLKPRKKVITGLKDVIEREAVHAKWTVQIRQLNAGRPDQRRMEKTVTQQAPINKTTLQNALRVADEWLQRVGIGIKITAGDYRSTEPLT